VVAQVLHLPNVSSEQPGSNTRRPAHRLEEMRLMVAAARDALDDVDRVLDKLEEELGD
jgi:hypothetical protein